MFERVENVLAEIATKKDTAHENETGRSEQAHLPKAPEEQISHIGEIVETNEQQAPDNTGDPEPDENGHARAKGDDEDCSGQ